MSLTRKRKADEALVLAEVNTLARECDKINNEWKKAKERYDIKLAEYNALPLVKKRKEEKDKKDEQAKFDAYWTSLASDLRAYSCTFSVVEQELKWLEKQHGGFDQMPKKKEYFDEIDFGMGTQKNILTYAMTNEDVVTVEWEQGPLGSSSIQVDDDDRVSADDVEFAMDDRKNSWSAVLQRVPDAKWHLGLLFLRRADALF